MPPTVSGAQAAEELARFLAARGGSMQCSQMPEFYREHPECVNAISTGKKAKIRSFCEMHAGRLRFVSNSGCGSVEVTEEWKARQKKKAKQVAPQEKAAAPPQPDQPARENILRLISVVHECGRLSPADVGKLAMPLKKLVTECGGLRPLAAARPEFFQYAGSGLSAALHLSHPLQKLWRCTDRLVAEGKGEAECGQTVATLYREDAVFKDLISKLGGAPQLAKAFSPDITFRSGRQQHFLRRACREPSESGASSSSAPASSRTGDPEQKESICCFWLQGTCKETGSHQYFKKVFLHERKPGLLCGGGPACALHQDIAKKAMEEAAVCCLWKRGCCPRTATHKTKGGKALLHEERVGLPCGFGASCTFHRVGGMAAIATAATTSAGAGPSSSRSAEEGSDTGGFVEASQQWSKWKPVHIGSISLESALRPPGDKSPQDVAVDNAPRIDPKEAEEEVPAPPPLAPPPPPPAEEALPAAAGKPRRAEEGAAPAPATPGAEEAADAGGGSAGGPSVLMGLASQLRRAKQRALEAWQRELEEVSARLAEECCRLEANERRLREWEDALARQGEAAEPGDSDRREQGHHDDGGAGWQRYQDPATKRFWLYHPATAECVWDEARGSGDLDAGGEAEFSA